jgi:hypothetical protein
MSGTGVLLFEAAVDMLCVVTDCHRGIEVTLHGIAGQLAGAGSGGQLIGAPPVRPEQRLGPAPLTSR